MESAPETSYLFLEYGLVIVVLIALGFSFRAILSGAKIEADKIDAMFYEERDKLSEELKTGKAVNEARIGTKAAMDELMALLRSHNERG